MRVAYKDEGSSPLRPGRPRSAGAVTGSLNSTQVFGGVLGHRQVFPVFSAGSDYIPNLMKPDLRWSICVLFLMSCSLALAGITPEQAKSLPPPAPHRIDFTKEIKPILEASCTKCHGRGKNKGDFQIDTRETFLKGGESGPAAVPGKSSESLLIELVSGVDPDNIMPQKGSKLTADQVGLLRAWIDQGLPWDASVSFAKIPPINLWPRSPQLPSRAKTTGSKNPVDLILQPYYAAHNFQPAKPVNDRLFARRLYLDVVGLLPTPTDLEEFAADKHSDKRARLVKRLLGENQRYAEHWLTFWNDALRNDYKGTGYIDEGRKQITGWLYAALAKNLPYDRFVAELINPTAESEGFVKGIVWRGVVNASQTPPMQAAQNISQVFMGVNLKCASCHDSFINDWALSDAYGLASIYAEKELEMVQCDKPTGHMSSMKFIYPELGAIDATATKPERMKQLAGIITQKQNGRLTRTIVNRLWAKLMGRGLVEPVDEMDTPAWNTDLLDWLAADLAENGYDLKKTLERILTSEAYQLPSIAITELKAKDYVFRGPAVRRLSGEQYIDALATVTGVGFTLPAARVDFAVAQPSANQSMAGRYTVKPKWIWSSVEAAQKAEPGTIYLRKEVHLPEAPTAAAVVVSCDNSFKLYINGKEAASGRDHTKPNLVDIRSHLTKGRNVIALAAVNDQGAPGKKDADQSNPAGLLLYARVRHERATFPTAASSANRRPKAASATVPVKGEDFDGATRIPVETVLDFASDVSWLCSTEKVDDWNKASFLSEGWKPACELGNIDMGPWNLEQKFSQALSAAPLYGRVRASLVNADPLMVALGRPNREQVITTRSSAATTLQALELTNGATLAEQLKRGAAKLLEGNPASASELISTLYQRALCRKPLPDELRLAADLAGSPVQKAGVEDLLWALTMLPEFQLIY
jgi:hypothetical protein